MSRKQKKPSGGKPPEDFIVYTNDTPLYLCRYLLSACLLWCQPLKPHAVGSMRKVYENYLHLKKVLPAMGYGKAVHGECLTVVGGRCRRIRTLPGPLISATRLERFDTHRLPTPSPITG